MEELKLPDKKYKCILADPPWEYDNKNTSGSNSSGACQQYSTMSLDDIKNMSVPEISMDNSCLFLWCTTPLLPYGFDVMKSWGFEYKTTIYWRKIMSLGMGYWFRGQVEVCLFGIKGKMKPFRCQRPNFIQSKVREHSRKPDDLYYIIESIGLNPKIELFARRKRKGWDVWGNDIKEFIQLSKIDNVEVI